MTRIRIGTRGSMLAMAQSRLVAEGIERAWGQVAVELVPIVTRGDRTSGPLAPGGGKGLFTRELEAALRSGAIDLAVHSAKDVPCRMAEDLVIAAVPERADPRDALVSASVSIEDLPHGARIGTGSPRRSAQLRQIRPDLEILPIRGNVETRLRKVFDPPRGQPRLEAVVLAMAGLVRSGLLERHVGCVTALDVDRFIPAAGQGALLVQAAAKNKQAFEAVAPLGHEPSAKALKAERHILRELGAECRSCVAVHVCLAGDGWRAMGMVARNDGSGAIHHQTTADEPEQAAEKLLDALRAGGAEALCNCPTGRG